MRRPGWLIIGLVLAALWAWSQWAAPPTPGPQSPSTSQGPEPHAPLATSSSDGSSRVRKSSQTAAGTTRGDVYPAYLPPEALDTLQLVARAGPYPHRQDGATFQNRERRLPAQPHGYYREYTVRTPGARERGARRIIAGGDPPAEFFYTDDHYRSFRRFVAAGAPR